MAVRKTARKQEPIRVGVIGVGCGHGFAAGAGPHLGMELVALCDSYAPMPFGERVVAELVNQSKEPHRQYSYVDYELDPGLPDDAGCFHAESRWQNPFRGWGPEIAANKAGAQFRKAMTPKR